ncbi:MAG: hypothetical protein U0V74_13885 [Chitinophagales bacterium]
MQQSRFRETYLLKLRFAFAAVVIILLYRLLQGVLLSQMQQPVLFQLPQNVYGLFNLSGISNWLTTHYSIALLTDILLFALALLSIITGNRITVILSTLLLTVYMLVFNMAAYHAYHGLVGAIAITIPFWSQKEERFNFLWHAARYYWLYVFASAGLWKILRASAFLNDQMSNILMQQQLDYLLQHPHSFKAGIIQYLISHPAVSHMVLLVNVGLQLSFLVGFFTRRFDTMLLVLSIVFCIANYFVMSIVSTELLVLNLTLLNWDKIELLFANRNAKASIA